MVENGVLLMSDTMIKNLIPGHEHKWVRDKNSALLISSPPQAWYECSICGERRVFFLNQEPKQEAADMVDNPPHYTSGTVECIDAIRSALTPEEFRGYCKGNVIKYAFRERMKGGDEDLRKARWYLDALLGKEDGE